VLRQPDTTLAAWTKVLAISALMFYPPALLLPMLRIEQFGHTQEAGLLAGVGTLWEQGHWFIGTVVLLFSIALPPLKLIALWLLSTPAIISRQHHRALLYHLVELLGRWGMLDVMLVAVLVAFVKLGDMIAIQPGSGLLAFAIMVLLSLLASVTFNPTLLWDAGGDGSKNAL
jgi:paraquat-inducible protein A